MLVTRLYSLGNIGVSKPYRLGGRDVSCLVPGLLGAAAAVEAVCVVTAAAEVGLEHTAPIVFYVEIY